MSSNSSPFVPLALALVTAVCVAAGIQQLGAPVKSPQSKVVSAPVAPRWSAAASGRVEPANGEIKLTALSSGRVAEVLVTVNDKVVAGDLLVKIADTDSIARLMGADAEAGVRKRERDSETNVPRLTQDRRAAEDQLNNTERAITLAREDLDRLQLARQARPASVTEAEIEAQRKILFAAQSRLQADRLRLRETQLATGVPLPTRLEAGLTTARTELSLAEAALERAKIRAPFDATVLQVLTSAGETASGSPEQPMVVIGDLSSLRVKAEVEERDVAKVTIGQDVILRSDAFAGREFKGRVKSIAQAMRPPKLAQRGPRRPNDVDTLEVLVDVAPGTPLIPGLRVDVFFVQAPVASGPVKTEASMITPDEARLSDPQPPVAKRTTN